MDAAWLGALAVRCTIAGGVVTVLVIWRGAARPLRWLHALVVLPLVVATGALAWSLVAGDFDVVYVADTTDRSSSWPIRLAGMWGGMEGSLLLLTCFLVLAGSVAGMLVARHDDRLSRAVTGITAAHAVAFAAVTATLADPFRRLDLPSLDGAGLNPVLRHDAMLYHPPLLYAGLAACLAVAAVALAGVLSGRIDDRWRALVGLTATGAWSLLTLGLVAGAHWAYVELGWGGYWAWDPVENAGLLPWLATGALVHAARDPRSPPRLLALLAATAHGLSLFGTYLTRSGAADSVHAFAEAADIGRALLVIASVFVLGTSAVLLRRQPAADTASRSTLLVVGVAIGAAVVVGLGTFAPVAAGAIGAGRAAVDGTYFARFTAPLGLLSLCLLAGSVPVWRRRLPVVLPVALGALGLLLVAGERQPFVLLAGPLAAGTGTLLGLDLVVRRHPTPAIVAHLGMVVLLAGIAGSTTGSTTAVVLPADGDAAVAGYRLVHEGVEQASIGGATRLTATIGLHRAGHRVATLRPARVARLGRGMVTAEAALRSTPLEDVLVTPRRIDGRDAVLLDVTVRPLVMLVWWGAVLVALGAAGGALRALRSGPLASGRGVDPRSPAGRRAVGAMAPPGAAWPVTASTAAVPDEPVGGAAGSESPVPSGEVLHRSPPGSGG